MASKRNRALKILINRIFARIERPSIKEAEVRAGLNALTGEEMTQIIECLRKDEGDGLIGKIIKHSVYEELKRSIEARIKKKYRSSDIPPEELEELL